MSKRVKVILAALGFLAVTAASVCVMTLQREAPYELSPTARMEDMPGISDDLARQVRAALDGEVIVVYGAVESAEAFYRADGSVGGYAGAFCNWLTYFFGARFEPRLFASQAELMEAWDGGEVDFVGLVPPGYEGGAYATEPLTERVMKMARLPGGRGSEGAPSYGFIADDGDDAFVFPRVTETEPDAKAELFDGPEEALAALRGGLSDAFIADDSVMDALDTTGLDVSLFAPLTYKECSFAALQEKFAPVVRAVDVYAKDGGMERIALIYRQGSAEHKKAVFTAMLNPAERALYEKLLKGGEPVLYAADSENYPIEFYNHKAKTFDGIATELLSQITDITGIHFKPYNEQGTSWPNLIDALEAGRVPMISELLRTSAREGRFIWAEDAYTEDRYALISRVEADDVTIGEIPGKRVGLERGTGYADVFLRWFPEHKGVIWYEDTRAAFAALKNGEIDLLMETENRLLTATNHMGLPGYRLNYTFNETSKTYFGFNKDQGTLRDLIGKAQGLVDTAAAVNRWTHRANEETFVRPSDIIAIVAIALLALACGALWARLIGRRRVEADAIAAAVEERAATAMSELKQLERAQFTKSAFWAGMSVEMRTPLNAVIGLAELTLGEDSLSIESRGNVEKIYNSGMTLLSIVNDILDISKLEAGTLTLRPIEYDLPSLINDAATLSAVRIGSKNVTFSMVVDPNAPSRLIGDEVRVKQIFSTLLSNAFQYTQEGAVEWSLGAEAGEGGEVWLVSTVKDTGVGVRPDKMDRLFAGFEQADRSRKTEGTGLSLSIAKKLAEMMGGELTAESVFGRGSAFNVRLRQRVAGSSAIGHLAAANLRRFRYSEHKRDRSAQFSRAYIPYATVLAVDDLQTNLDITQGMLKPYGMKVDAVLDGKAAIALIRKGEPKYSAILMDHMMPEMDGMMTTKIIREIGTEYAKSIPIIALTADASNGYEEMFLRNGFNAFLSKPIDILCLDAVVNRFIRNPETERALMTAADLFAIESNGSKVFLGRDIDGLEFERAMPRFADERAYVDALREFAKQAPPLLSEMSGVTANTLGAYAQAAEAFQQLASSVGAVSAAARAEALADAGRTGDFGRVAVYNRGFVLMAEQLAVRVSAFLREVGEDEGRPLKPEPDEAALEALLSACRAYDVDEVDKAMAELTAYSYASDGALVQWLKGRADVMAYRQIAERLEAELEARA